VIKAVVDTNILIAALINEAGAPAKLLDFWERGFFEIVLSDDVFNEYKRTFWEFTDRVESEKIAELLEALRDESIWVEPSQAITVCRDISDNKFLECAIEGNADYLVTKNIRHFPKFYEGVKVVRIRRLLSRLGTL